MIVNGSPSIDPAIAARTPAASVMPRMRQNAAAPLVSAKERRSPASTPWPSSTIAGAAREILVET